MIVCRASWRLGSRSSKTCCVWEGMRAHACVNLFEKLCGYRTCVLSKLTLPHTWHVTKIWWFWWRTRFFTCWIFLRNSSSVTPVTLAVMRMQMRNSRKWGFQLRCPEISSCVWWIKDVLCVGLWGFVFCSCTSCTYLQAPYFWKNLQAPHLKSASL